jgi:hypothetical protein
VICWTTAALELASVQAPAALDWLIGPIGASEWPRAAIFVRLCAPACAARAVAPAV